MALLKAITLDNGVTTKYHRIVSMNVIVNNQIIIEVASYTDVTKREEEKEYYQNEETESMNVYIETEYINIDYDEDMSIKKAYEYLKTLEKYEDAKDC